MAYALCSRIAIVEKMVIGVNEYFGECQVRITERFRACGGRVDRSFGDIFSPEEIKTAVQGQDLERMGIFRVETSTGAYQAQEKRCCTICSPAGFHDGMLRFLGGLPDEDDCDRLFSSSV
jgi:aspartate aminotransferase-like enzyme